MIVVESAAAVERQHAAPHPRRHEGAEADQAPERALRRSTAAGVADIGDHEGHVGDVAGAEQEIAGEIDQHRPDRERAPALPRRSRRSHRSAPAAAEASWRPRAASSPTTRSTTIPARRPAARTARSGRTTGCRCRAGVEQAEQEIRALGPRLRDRRRQRAAADESGRGADPASSRAKLKHEEIARDRAQRQRRDAGQRSPAHRSPTARSAGSARRHQRADEIADGVDGVHEAGGGIRPAERSRACPAAPANRRSGRCRGRWSAPATG